MTVGDVLSWVLVGFVFIWAADVLRLWSNYDIWREERAARRAQQVQRTRRSGSDSRFD